MTILWTQRPRAIAYLNDKVGIVGGTKNVLFWSQHSRSYLCCNHEKLARFNIENTQQTLITRIHRMKFSTASVKTGAYLLDLLVE